MIDRACDDDHPVDAILEMRSVWRCMCASLQDAACALRRSRRRLVTIPLKS
jgi:hypothetical protein